MTKRQVRAAVERWRRVLAPEWLIHVEFDPYAYDEGFRPDDDSIANSNAIIWRPDHYERAVLFVCDDFWGLSPLNQEISLCHEVLHLTLRDYAHAANTIPTLGRNANRLHDAHIEHAEERLVERLAVALVSIRLSGGRVRFPPQASANPAPRRRT